MFQKLHHVAYRCRDAQETVDLYTKVLGLKYAAGEVAPEGARPYGEEVDLRAGFHYYLRLKLVWEGVASPSPYLDVRIWRMGWISGC